MVPKLLNQQCSYAQFEEEGQSVLKSAFTQRLSRVTRRKHAIELCKTTRWCWLPELLDIIVASLSRRVTARQLQSHC